LTAVHNNDDKWSYNETMTQRNLSSLKSFSRVFFHSDERWLTQYCLRHRYFKGPKLQSIKKQNQQYSTVLPGMWEKSRHCITDSLIAQGRYCSNAFSLLFYLGSVADS
jgi:hypothetical protein